MLIRCISLSDTTRQAEKPVERFDYNLFRVLAAVHDTGNVSRAAHLLGMSQPAVSMALAKLRKQFNDPLFVRTAHGMDATPLGRQLGARAQALVILAEQGLRHDAIFDASSFRGTFTITLSDVGEMVFVPRLLEQIRQRAPMASLRSVAASPRDTETGLENGSIDLAVGYFPDLKGRLLLQQRLFTHYFLCIARADHPIAGETLSMAQFLACEHAVVQAESRTQELFERFLSRKSIERRIALHTPHFMSLPFIVARSDLIATVPHALALGYTRSFENLKLMRPELALPRFDLRQHWHKRFNNDPKCRWLRSLVSELFNDQEDEWVEASRPAAKGNGRAAGAGKNGVARTGAAPRKAAGAATRQNLETRSRISSP